MTDFFKLLIDFISSLFSLLFSVTFEFFGYQVSYASIIFVLIVFGFFACVFWKGARQ